MTVPAHLALGLLCVAVRAAAGASVEHRPTRLEGSCPPGAPPCPRPRPPRRRARALRPRCRTCRCSPDQASAALGVDLVPSEACAGMRASFERGYLSPDPAGGLPEGIAVMVTGPGEGTVARDDVDGRVEVFRAGARPEVGHQEGCV